MLLGSTGSIGTQALSVIEANRSRFRVVGLAAGGARPGLLADQAVRFDVPVIGLPTAQAAEEFMGVWSKRHSDRREPEVVVGEGAAAELAGMPCDVVLNGMTGAVGLEPTLAALASGATLALANKESLIVGGPLVRAAARPGQIVPVDSEHSALAQCLAAGDRSQVRRLVLTASGGPFRGRRRLDLQDVSPEAAMAHPTWDMGPVITINSATMVNKGLEVIEAHLLFDVPLADIDVVVHPQSVVHSMVEFVDGSTLAQASPPDMRLPIALGLAWPERLPGAAPPCDWTRASTWSFEPLDDEAFPAVALARAAGTAGGTAPAVYNAANEVAVAHFRAGRLSFLGIVDTVARVLDDHDPVAPADLTLADVREADAWARERATRVVRSGAGLGAGRP